MVSCKGEYGKSGGITSLVYPCKKIYVITCHGYLIGYVNAKDIYVDGITCDINVIAKHNTAIDNDTIHNPLLKYIFLIFILSPLLRKTKIFFFNRNVNNLFFTISLIFNQMIQ